MRFSILASTVAASLILTACGPNYSNGDRDGTVTKLSYKGLIWKSWEGSLNQGGVRTAYVANSDGNGTHSETVPNVMDFNADPAVVPKLEEAMRSGKRVRLTYRQWAIAPLQIENDHVVIAVEFDPEN